MADLVGQQLGNSRLIRLLGKGGYAEVYLGEHVRLNTPAAIKVLHTRLANSEEVGAQFNALLTFLSFSLPSPEWESLLSPPAPLKTKLRNWQN
jgi:serine/threonine protein kinase